MKDDQHWAHVRIDADTGRVVPHLLVEHLNAVSERAATYAETFAADWARFAGLWHDLGKYRPGFGKYIRQANAVDAHIEGRVKDRDKTHSAAGAVWAERLLAERFDMQGRMMSRALQYAIAGHHAGLDNWHDGLAVRLASADAHLECDQALAAGPPPGLLRPDGLPESIGSLPVGNEGKDIPGRFALWQRMLFSALVDADFLDTEAFLDASRSTRRGDAPGIAALKLALDEHMAALTANASDTPVNQLRAGILRQCRETARRPPTA